MLVHYQVRRRRRPFYESGYSRRDLGQIPQGHHTKLLYSSWSIYRKVSHEILTSEIDENGSEPNGGRAFANTLPSPTTIKNLNRNIFTPLTYHWSKRTLLYAIFCLMLLNNVIVC